MWCIASLFWHDRFQWSESARARACVLVLTCSFTRCSKYNTACFDCLRTVHAYFSSVLPFTTINKWFNAEVTWIPKESSLLQSHTFVVFFLFVSVLFGFFSYAAIVHAVTCDCNFDCFFYAVCIICIFHFYFMFWKIEHAPPIQRVRCLLLLLLKLNQ